MVVPRPVLMTPNSRKVLGNLVHALRNLKGSNGIEARYIEGSGVLIANRQKAAPLPEIQNQQSFIVRSEQINHLVCWATGIDNVDIDVAKPPHLRGFVDSKTVDSEDQTISPSYSTGDIVYGSRPTGGTGLTDIFWKDNNDAARTWTTADCPPAP